MNIDAFFKFVNETTNEVHFNHTTTFKMKCKRNDKKMTKLQQL